MVMKANLGSALLLSALVSACGDDGGGTGGGGGGSGGGNPYVGRATVIVMNPGPERLALEVHDSTGEVRTTNLAPAAMESFSVGLLQGSTLEDEPCLAPDVRRPGEPERISPVICATDGDVVAVVGYMSMSRSQLPPKPASGVQISHLTALTEAGKFFAVDPATNEATQLLEVGQTAVDVAYDAALGYLPPGESDIVIHAESGWLGGPLGFEEGAQLVSMGAVLDASGSPAHFVACEFADALYCMTLAPPR